MSKDFSHLDSDGKPTMVDVGDKEITHRTAIAESIVTLPPEVQACLEDGDIMTKKGSVFQTATLAGIMAAKKTWDLIPLCHPIPLNKCDVSISIDGDQVKIHCTAKTHGKTGVEMEALTGASVAALTIYDMCKAISHDIIISSTRLMSKTGGKSDFKRT